MWESLKQRNVTVFIVRRLGFLHEMQTVAQGNTGRKYRFPFHVLIPLVHRKFRVSSQVWKNTFRFFIRWISLILLFQINAVVGGKQRLDHKSLSQYRSLIRGNCKLVYQKYLSGILQRFINDVKKNACGLYCLIPPWGFIVKCSHSD